MFVGLPALLDFNLEWNWPSKWLRQLLKIYLFFSPCGCSIHICQVNLPSLLNLCYYSVILFNVKSQQTVFIVFCLKNGLQFFQKNSLKSTQGSKFKNMISVLCLMFFMHLDKIKKTKKVCNENMRHTKSI